MGLIGFLTWLLNSGDSSRMFGVPVPNEMNLEASLSGGVSELPPDAIMSATPRPMSEIARDQIAQLQRIDPDFNEVAFLSQATNAFQAALQAEAAMNPDAASSIGTNAFVDCLKQKVAGWRTSGLTRTIAGLKLDPPTLMKISVDGTQQQVTVRFTGTAVQAQWFTEFATFVRPAGSTTPKAAAVGAPVNCPKCGAPAPPGALVCPYCSSPLSGTGGTWLLDHLSASAYT